MKKSIFGALAVILPLIALSQQPRKWDKRPMSEFRNDTIKYIKHNFNPDNKSMQEHFDGKTIGEIIPELGFSVKYISASGFIKNDIVDIMFVAMGRRNRGGTFETTNGLQVILATPISAQNNPVAYDKVTSQTEVPFTKELFDLIKDMKVNYITETETELVTQY